jgi:arsenate reductase
MGMEPKRKVLFLCTGNSCRSRMAEAWTGALHGGTMEAFSAGVEPSGLDPMAARVMAEVGVEIPDAPSRHVDLFIDAGIDWVVTVCDGARTRCPVFPGDAAIVHAGFDDPPALAREAATDEERIGIYRRVRDEIREFVEGLPGLLQE